MMQVIKRNGDKENFDVKKIAIALFKVYEEIGEETTMLDCLDQAHYLTSYYLEENIDELDIEDIQDDVILYLVENKRRKAAKAYAKYRAVQEYNRDHPWMDMDERQETILMKYTKPGETIKEFLKRVSNGNQKIEKIFRNREAIHGGRNLYAVGREGNITGSNCYVAPDPQDDLKSIFDTDYIIARTYSYGGGQGLNLSNLRPRGAAVNNASNTTPGPMNFARRYSFTTEETQQDQRRGALMLVMNITHPDIIDFITTKLDLTQVNGANISIAITDEFMKAAIAGEDWTMSFETPYEIIEKTVNAMELLRLIAFANHTMGDPGMLFIDRMNNYHLLSEYKQVYFTATNPCGEQPLMPNGSCNLGSINLNAFVSDPFTGNAFFDTLRFKEVVFEMVWALDDLLTELGERHALQEQRDHVVDWREIGLGVMGLADLALSTQNGYGSDNFIGLTGTIMECMANFAAQASALKAKEEGPFPMYDFDLISQSDFYNDVYWDDTKELIQKYGLRNSRLLSIAPTGSISNLLGISGGVEPYFMLGYIRRIISMFEQEKEITVWEKTPLKLAQVLGIDKIEDLPQWAKVTSQNVPFETRAEVQSTIQKYVDTAISSTFNLHNSANVEDIVDIYVTAWEKGLKGATVFRNNCAKIGVLKGEEVDSIDQNPAPPTEIEVRERWTNKITGEVKEFVNIVQVQLGEMNENKIERELCPLCGDVLVKRGGCTKCRDNECLYEKCSL